MADHIIVPISTIYPRVGMEVISFKDSLGKIIEVMDGDDPVVTIKWEDDPVIEHSVFPISRMLGVKVKATPGDCTMDGYILLTDNTMCSHGDIFVSVNQAMVAKRFGWTEKEVPSHLHACDRDSDITIIYK
jgi:hypothetical protein